jgi:hypothetical protein
MLCPAGGHSGLAEAKQTQQAKSCRGSINISKHLPNRNYLMLTFLHSLRCRSPRPIQSQSLCNPWSLIGVIGLGDLLVPKMVPHLAFPSTQLSFPYKGLYKS